MIFIYELGKMEDFFKHKSIILNLGKSDSFSAIACFEKHVFSYFIDLCQWDSVLCVKFKMN